MRATEASLYTMARWSPETTCTRETPKTPSPSLSSTTSLTKNIPLDIPWGCCSPRANVTAHSSSSAVVPPVLPEVLSKTSVSQALLFAGKDQLFAIHTAAAPRLREDSDIRSSGIVAFKLWNVWYTARVRIHIEVLDGKNSLRLAISDFGCRNSPPCPSANDLNKVMQVKSSGILSSNVRR